MPVDIIAHKECQTFIVFLCYLVYLLRSTCSLVLLSCVCVQVWYEQWRSRFSCTLSDVNVISWRPSFSNISLFYYFTHTDSDLL